MYLLAFFIGSCVGAAIGASLMDVFWEGEVKRRGISIDGIGIDPEELVAWIENNMENYEYVAPPTAGEIICKIREMEEEQWS